MFGEVTINEKKVQLKASLMSQMIYKQSFGKEMFADFFELQEQVKNIKTSKKNSEIAEIEYFGRGVYYKILWAFAKTADKLVCSFEPWLDSITSINFDEVSHEVNRLIDIAAKIDQKNV